jgi:hypothetical protein
MRLIFIILSVFALSFANALSLKDKIIKGQPGDYVVTEQGKVYTVLLIRAVSESHLLLEEISVPEADIDLGKISWKNWIESKAPGNTSWTAYEIDLKTNELVEGYSYSRRAFLFAGDPNHFLAKLLALSLKPTPEEKRRRIGPPPSEDEIDHRAFWNPSVVIDGKKIKKPSLSSWTGRWPNDGSLLSDCDVELYFGSFAFPYWIDVKSPHYRASIQTVDSGNHLNSPMPLMPRRPPEFLGRSSWQNKTIEVKLKCPAHYEKLNVYVIDLSSDFQAPIPLKASQSRDGDTVTLKIEEEILQAVLQKGHKYHWIVAPENTSSVVAESEEVFIW